MPPSESLMTVFSQSPLTSCWLRLLMALRIVFDEREIDPQLCAVCGLYCGICPVYRAWTEQDLPRLDAIAGTLGVSRERLLCTGCRTPAAFCFGGECEVKECAEAKGVAFCAECAEFPCPRIERVMERAPHGSTILANGTRIRDVGWYAWLREQDARWRCPSCHGKVAFGAERCPSCHGPLSLR